MFTDNFDADVENIFENEVSKVCILTFRCASPADVIPTVRPADCSFSVKILFSSTALGLIHVHIE